MNKVRYPTIIFAVLWMVDQYFFVYVMVVLVLKMTDASVNIAKTNHFLSLIFSQFHHIYFTSK